MCDLAPANLTLCVQDATIKRIKFMKRGEKMGKFIITRTALGDRFCLMSDSDRTLAVSRHYATLDACKKGIASLVTNAPTMPVRDTTAGEYGKNPKFEIIARDKGVAFLVKSPNGKAVITSPTYATKKACLRAISMLRLGVRDCEILFHNKEGYTPLSMKALDGVGTARATKKPTEPLTPAAPTPFEDISLSDDTALDDVIDTPCEVVPPEAPLKSPAVPRLIRVQQAPKTPPQAPTPTREPLAEKREGGFARYGLLGKIFKK